MVFPGAGPGGVAVRLRVAPTVRAAAPPRQESKRQEFGAPAAPYKLYMISLDGLSSLSIVDSG